MGLVEMFGCMLLAFGPPLVMFILTVANDPIRIILLITSGFFWLVSLLVSALIWFAIKPLDYGLEVAMIISVLIQELFRFMFFILIKKAQRGLSKLQTKENNDLNFDLRIISYVSGLGFGIMSGVFSLVNILNDMNGPATLGLYEDSQFFFLFTSFTSLCLIIFHVFWSVILYLGLVIFNRRSIEYWTAIVSVIGSHLLFSALSWVNNSKKPVTYWYSGLLNVALLGLNGLYAFQIVRRSYKQRLSL